MKGILKFSTKNGHTRSLVNLYVLHSLHREPKTGYDLLREIEDVTEGEWVPSKGTLYPMLHHLTEEGLIAPQETGARSKTVFALTEEGEKTLAEFKKHRHQSQEKFQLLRKIHAEIFGEEFASRAEKLWKIRETIHGLPEEKQQAALEVLDTCISALLELKEENTEGEKQEGDR